MLTIQPGISKYYSSKPVFNGNEKKKADNPPQTDEVIIANLRKKGLSDDEVADEFRRIKFKKDEEKYNETVSRTEEAKDEIMNLVDKAPPPVKTTGQILAIGATSIVGGMALGWGGRKSFQAVRELFSTEGGKKFADKFKGCFGAIKDGMVSLKDSVVQGYRNVKSSFKSSNLYNKSKIKYDNFFENNSFGKKLSSIKKSIVENSVYKKVSGGISNAYNTCKDSVVNIYRKIQGIKADQVEKITVNTLGISGGVATGVMESKKVVQENLEKAENED